MFRISVHTPRVAMLLLIRFMKSLVFPLIVYTWPFVDQLTHSIKQHTPTASIDLYLFGKIDGIYDEVGTETSSVPNGIHS